MTYFLVLLICLQPNCQAPERRDVDRWEGPMSAWQCHRAENHLSSLDHVYGGYIQFVCEVHAK